MTRASSGDDSPPPLTDNYEEANLVLETVVETTGVGTIKLDGTGTIVAANERFCELVGCAADQLRGTAVATLFAANDPLPDTLAQLDSPDSACCSGTLEAPGDRPIHCDLRFRRLNDDAESVLVVVKPTSSTDAESREQAASTEPDKTDLERYKTIVTTVHDGVYITNENYEFEMVNDGYASMVGYDREELIGEHVSTVVNDEVVDQGRELRRELRDDESEGGEIEVSLKRLNGEEVTIEARYAPLQTEDGSFKGTVGVVRNLTDHRQRVQSLERRVRQQRSIADFGQQALTERDLDGLLETATELVASTLDVELTKVLDLDEVASQLHLRAGVGWQDGLVGNAAVGTEENSQAGYTLLSAEPVVVADLRTETRFSGPDLLIDHDVVSGISVLIGPPEDPWGVFGAHTTQSRVFTDQDITFVRNMANILAAAISRTSRERELERYETIVETIWDGVYALDPDDNFVMVNDSFCAMSGFDREELLGEHATIVHDQTIQTKTRKMAAQMRDGSRETATIELNLRRRDGTSIPVESQFGSYPYQDDADGRAGVVRDITERKAWERQIEMLNELNEVVREITHAIVASSARGDVERLVCERFGTANLYEFAWLGTADDDGTNLTSIAEAGVSDYLESVTITADEGDTGQGPTGRALREQTAMFATNVLEDESYVPWHDDARERGYQSVAAIPISYRDIQYGVLTIYSAREDAFGEHERRILSQVGDVVGHAINAIERKEALMADRITEVTFQTETLPDAFRALEGEMGAVTVDRVVPLNDGTVLQYHAVRDMSASRYRDALANASSIADIREVSSTATVTRFEVVTNELTVGSILATYGGRLHSFAFTKDGVEIEAELPESVDVRKVTNAVRDLHPELELVSRNTVNRQVTLPGEFTEDLIGQLTDRQHAALKSAYYAGFFDWPRASAGTDVAATLDVSPATFHEHLRRAQQKILTALFE